MKTIIKLTKFKRDSDKTPCINIDVIRELTKFKKYNVNLCITREEAIELKNKLKEMI